MVFAQPPGKHSVDSDQFAPPAAYGGTLAVKVAKFDKADTTAKTVFTLPAGAVPIDWWLDVTEDFNAGTNNNLDIGAAADADYFAADLAIGTLGLFRAGAANSVAGRLGVRFDEPTVITVLFKPTGTTVTTGEANFFMTYMMGSSQYLVE